ncbi:hypothetical protein EXIGLDRAFT_723470 [Exidia glandulosa HHB12029]|uniref:N-acetyltransferase domain-containing protein n=1 Tax=Exidia glandulosa HHB12029 TaxID=1314781 RepID=A0A165ETA2_EXIGL|nr:hypothetical protein EXIGLDRAFT_723470 [Exidia glandulosa HHB12029]
MSPAPLPVETPFVAGLPTTLYALSPDELAKSPLLEPLFRLMNAACIATHGPPYFPAPAVRFASLDALIAELAKDGTVYMLAQTLPGGEVRVVGSVSDEPYEEPTVEEKSTGKATPADFHPRLEGDAEHEYRRALRLLATDPTLHRQGIGGFLMTFLEDHLIRRAKALRQETESRRALTHFHWVLTTVGEINGRFYMGRGWRMIQEKPVPAGYLDLGVPITIATMDKLVELDPSGA